MQKFKSVEELVNQLKPDKPVYCIRKNSILSASKFFQKKFLGKTLLERKNAKLLFRRNGELGGALVLISWSPKDFTSA